MSPPLHSTHVLVSSFATNNVTGIALMTGSPRIHKDLEKFELSTKDLEYLALPPTKVW